MKSIDWSEKNIPHFKENERDKNFTFIFNISNRTAMEDILW